VKGTRTTFVLSVEGMNSGDYVHGVRIPVAPISSPPPAPVKQQTLPSLSELFLGKENIVRGEGKAVIPRNLIFSIEGTSNTSKAQGDHLSTRDRRSPCENGEFYLLPL
jgi:hypothetical protein